MMEDIHLSLRVVLQWLDYAMYDRVGVTDLEIPYEQLQPKMTNL